ncbi:MAG: SAM-dependent methyltransferase [Burkholderiales bacterium]|nr:SAM-dependent methyltransferase [Burkholderiales bacterium]
MTNLYLIPTTLSNKINNNALLDYQLRQIKHLQHFIVETPKTARSHLKQLQLNTPIQELCIDELNKHNNDVQGLIQPLLDGHDMGLLSDCGLPAIADPGAIIVKMAHLNNINVLPLVGPSSLMLALMASGVSGQSFAFNGYMPIGSNEQKQKILALQELIMRHKQSQIIIETPFRNQQLLENLINILHNDITICIAINLMQDNQLIISKSVIEWVCLSKLPNIHKQEVVFVVGI